MLENLSIQKKNSASTFVPPRTNLAPQTDSTQAFVPRDTGLQMSPDWSIQASSEEGLTMADIDKQLASPSSGFMDQLVSNAEEPPNTESVGVQPKLAMGQVGDAYEVEADQVADRVMRMPEPLEEQSSKGQGEVVQRQPVALSISRLVQAKCSKCQEEEAQEKGIQRKEIAPESGIHQSQATPSLESRLAANAGGGSALPDDVRSFMEPRFGADFSSVRVHTDSQAVQMSQELGAQAFTYGNDIYYGQEKSLGNNDLTAHELTHTIQQMGAVQAKPTVKQLGDQKAQETESMATEMGSQMNVPQSQSVQNVVMLTSLDPENDVGLDPGMETPVGIGVAPDKNGNPQRTRESFCLAANGATVGCTVPINDGFYTIASSDQTKPDFQWIRGLDNDSSLVAQMHIDTTNNINCTTNNNCYSYLGLQQNIKTGSNPIGGIDFNDPEQSPLIVDIEKIKFQMRATLSPQYFIGFARANYYFQFWNPNILDSRPEVSYQSDNERKNGRGNTIGFDILQYAENSNPPVNPPITSNTQRESELGNNPSLRIQGERKLTKEIYDTWQLKSRFWSEQKSQSSLPPVDFSAKNSQRESQFEFTNSGSINDAAWLDVEIPVANIIERMIADDQLECDVIKGAKYTGGIIGGLEIFGPAKATLQVKNHTMIKKSSSKSIQGTNGNDCLIGAEGDNTINGLQGDDLIEGRGGNDTIYGEKDNDSLRGGKGNDILSGNQGNDQLFGELGDDKLYGGKGNDKLYGGKGNDSLQGGAGDDLLSGDRGSDTFVFHAAQNAGNDVILDFQIGEDVIELVDFPFDNFQDMMRNAVLEDQQFPVKLSFPAQNISIQLNGIKKDQLYLIKFRFSGSSNSGVNMAQIQ